MNPEFDIYEKIDLYLNGNMESGERRAFESQMHSDPALKEQVEAQRIANMIVLDQGMIDLKAQMQRDMSSSSSPGSGISSITVAIIGAVVLSASVATFLFTSNSPSEESVPEKNNNEVISGNATSSETPVSQTSPASGNIPAKKDYKVPVNESVTDEVISEPEMIVPLTDVPDKEPYEKIEPVQNIAIEKGKCDEYEIQATINTYDPCPGSLGWLEVNDVKNGKAPYTFSLQNQEFSTKYHYGHLEVGYYILTIKDANGCTQAIPATIKLCTSDPIYVPQQLKGGDYTFEPEIDREWTVPLSLEKNATLKIISRSGVTVFENKITYESGFMWNGQNSGGVNIDAGYYVYILQYEDGSIEKGTITILR